MKLKNKELVLIHLHLWLHAKVQLLKPSDLTQGTQNPSPSLSRSVHSGTSVDSVATYPSDVEGGCGFVSNVEFSRFSCRTEEEFRADIQRATSTNNEFIVVSYDRKSIGQTGTGHFSPVAGYHQETDSGTSLLWCHLNQRHLWFFSCAGLTWFGSIAA